MPLNALSQNEFRDHTRGNGKPSSHGIRRPRPPEHYVALVGGITELVGREVRAGAEAALPRLEDALTMAAVAMLR